MTPEDARRAWYREQAWRWGGTDEHDDIAVMHPDNSYYFARLAAHFGRLALGHSLHQETMDWAKWMRGEDKAVSKP